MSLQLQTDDFLVEGPLGPQWLQTVGGGFTVTPDLRAQPNTLAADAQTTLATFDPATVISTSPQRVIRYELDVTFPNPLPTVAGQNVKLGVTGLNRSTQRDGLGFQLERLNAGASNNMRIVLRNAAGTETPIAIIATAAWVAGETVRLMVDVAFQPTFITVSVTATGSAGTNNSGATISLATFNAGTGRALASLNSSTMYGGAFLRIDGSVVGYMDRFRVEDIGLGAVQPNINPVYTLTVNPTLTSITVQAEDDGAALTLTVQPDRPTEPRENWGGASFVADGGHMTTRATQSRARTLWSPFSWASLNQTDYDLIVALHAAAFSKAKVFSWTDPDTVTVYRLRFMSELRTRMISRGPGGRIFEISVDVEQVLAA